MMQAPKTFMILALANSFYTAPSFARDWDANTSKASKLAVNAAQDECDRVKTGMSGFRQEPAAKVARESLAAKAARYGRTGSAHGARSDIGP